MLTPNVGIYYKAVFQKIQKSKANQSTSEGESLGRQFAPSLPPDSLLGSVLSVYLQRGLYASCRAAGPARWVSADLEQRMTTTHTTVGNDEQFDAFDISISPTSNEKSTHGAGVFTDLTDLTANRKRVYVAPAPARTRTRPLGDYTYLHFRKRQIRQIRQKARRRGHENGLLKQAGVKSVKCSDNTDNEVTG